MNHSRKVLLFILCLIISCDLVYAETSGHFERNPNYDKYQSLSPKEKLQFLKPLEYLYVEDEQVDKSTDDLADVDYYLSAEYTDSSFDLEDNDDNIYVIKDYYYNGDTLSLATDKNQYSLNVCWAFATNNAIESYLALHKITNSGKKYNLSENYLEYISYLNVFNQVLSPENIRGYFNNGYMFGSSNSQVDVTRYLLYGYAPMTENRIGTYHTIYDPYFDPRPSFTGNNNGVSLLANFEKVDIDITGVKIFNRKASNQVISIKKHLINNGGLYGGTYVDEIDDYQCLNNNGNNGANHAITIVGWDNSKCSGGAWIAVNSWGNNGRKFYIPYNDPSLLDGFLGITGANYKEWTNAYKKASHNNGLYEFQLDTSTERLHSVKIMAMKNNAADENILGNTKVSIVTSNGETLLCSDCMRSGNLEQGVLTIDFSDNNIQLSDTVYVRLQDNANHAKSIENNDNTNAVILYTSAPVKYNNSYITGPDYMELDLLETQEIMDINNNTFINRITLDNGISISNMYTADGQNANNNSIIVTGNYFNVGYVKGNGLYYSTSGFDEIYKKIYVVINGDVDSDGKIRSSDYRNIKRHIMGDEFIGGIAKSKAADFNNDNKIDSKDSVALKKYLMRQDY